MKRQLNNLARIVDVSVLLEKSADEITNLLKDSELPESYTEKELFFYLQFLQSIKFNISKLEGNKKAIKKKGIQEKIDLTKGWINKNIETPATAFFLNAFKWSFYSKKYEKQSEIYQKKYIEKSLTLITEIFKSVGKTKELDYFFKIIFLYIVELITSDVSEEEKQDVQRKVLNFIEEAESLQKVPSNKYEELYSGYIERGWTEGYPAFVSHIDYIKGAFSNPELNEVLKTFSIDELIKILKETIYDAEGQLMNIDYNRLLIVDNYIVDMMDGKIQDGDVLYTSLIYSLNDYKVLLETLLRKNERGGLGKVLLLPEMFTDKTKLKKLCDILLSKNYITINDEGDYIWKGIPRVRGKFTQMVAMTELLDRLLNNHYNGNEIHKAYSDFFHVKMTSKIFQDNLSGDCQKFKPYFSFIRDI